MRLGILTPSEGVVVDPDTAEAVEVAAVDIDTLAAARAALVELDHERRAALAIVDAEIVARTDAAIRAGDVGAYTYETAGGYKLAVDTPDTARLDGAAFRADLLSQTRALGLEADAVEGLFGTRQYYSLRLARYNALRRQLPQLDEIKARHSEPQRRSVKVTAPVTSEVRS